jgi:[acyl-carrier-protein] S-malonyltransferase
MGKEFVDAFPSAKHCYQRADEALERDLSRIILQGPEDELTHTKNSQSGIFVCSMAILGVLQEQFPALQPTVCAGLSLGEYTAVAASQRLDFESCLKLVQYRGSYMNDACEAHPGAMAVVMGLDAEVVEALVDGLELPQDLWCANFNCPGQVVVSGTQRGVDAAAEACKAAGAKRVLPLTVHGAFHSGLMQDAQDRLAPKVQDVKLRDSKVQLVMNVPGDYVQDVEQMRNNLIQQVTHPVRWESGIRRMEESGVDLYIEIGCGKTLAGMNKRIKVQAPTLSIERVQDLDKLAEVDGLLR